MRMVVTGREGQVVRSLVERAAGSELQVIPLGRPALDLTASEASLLSALEDARPDILVSAAAYTQVDRAESEPELAFCINANGAGKLARAAARLSIPLIHLSTDYVFDGLKASPYVESDTTGPRGVYGSSKLIGEQAVLTEQPDSAVLRTAWVYSPFGSNFVKTMLRLAGDRDEISVVADQRGNPTSALDIADGIMEVASNLIRSEDASIRGIFHMAAQGEASWAEFAQAIFANSADLGGPSARVKSISTAEYPTAAERPANSRLDCSKLNRVHHVCLPDWRQSVKHLVGRLVRDGGA